MNWDSNRLSQTSLVGFGRKELYVDLSQLICEFPGDRTEADWLTVFEHLRRSLAESLDSDVQLGSYTIDDFKTYSSSGGCARVRGRSKVPGTLSDSWEGILCWSGNRGKAGHAAASIFPFLNGSVIQANGRLEDLGQAAETNQQLEFKFENGQFAKSGWVFEDGPGEWASVSRPGSVYLQDLSIVCQNSDCVYDQPIEIELNIPHFSPDLETPKARISLIHVNRNRERTNLVPWTSQPPKSNSRYTLSSEQCSQISKSKTRFSLNQFPIRGGWTPGRYYLSVRVQNFHDPKHWAWTSFISEPIRITIH